MEPSHEAISVRLARLCSEFTGNQVKVAGSAARWRRALHREGLLDALTTLYDECNNDALKRQDDHIAKFVDKYRCVLTELRRVRVNINDFEVKDLIGRGHFGEVHVVREKLTGDVYAMKTLRKDETLTQKEVAFYEEERDIMALATSPWITRLQYAFQDSSHLYLVMEFCAGGDLAALLERRAEPLKQRDAAFYVAQLNQSLNAIHTMGFLHRDIKPDNVLIDRCGHLKLADFGSAVRIGQSGRASSRVPVGTPDYIAPELLAAAERSQPASHGAAVDYWSLGVVAYELVTLRTPFAEKSKSSVAHTFGNIQRYREGKFQVEWPSEDEKPTEEYRDLVRCLLRVDPSKRYNYLETLRHHALKDMSWNTIRDQVPPFVPLVRSNDDTSHFSECSLFAERSTPALRNFRSKSTFSGANLPFIGFTYAPEPCAPLGHVCCNHGGADSTTSTSSGGFNTTFNNTAIELSNYREMEKLAERRAVEIESLQRRAAQAESESVLQRERERRITTLEQQRTKLEHELTELIVQNQRLSRQLEMEHEERGDLERKSLELIESAKRKWMEKSRLKTEELRSQISSQEKLIRNHCNENEGLKARIEDLTAELRSSVAELEAMKKLQLNYKEVLYMVHELKHRRFTEVNVRPIDNMAKARAVSRASIAGLANAEAAAGGASETTREVAREKEARRTAEAQVATVTERLKRLEDTETALRLELHESRKDYADLKDRFAIMESERNKLCNEASNMEVRKSQADRRNNDLVQRVGVLEERLATEKRDADSLRAKIDELKSKVTENTSAERALEEQHARTTSRLQEKLEASQQQCIELQSQLDAATNSSHRHRDKIAELECLVMKLDGEVSKLELQRGRGAGDGLHNAAHAQVELLKEQLAKAEQQLQATRDELHTLKQEARKTTSALWKKEKELSDCDLDRRIAVRELKAAEEKAARATELRRAAIDNHLSEKRRLEALVASAEQAAKDAKAEVEQLVGKLAEAECTLAERQERIQRRGEAEDKLIAEIDRCKNDIRKLKCELQYSESRRLKAEAAVERDRDEVGRAREERGALREELAGIRAALDERTRHNEMLEHNNKMLQDACSMLEEQLVDFERISDLQENKNKNMESEVSRIRAELEQCRAQLMAAESRAEDSQQRAGSAARQHSEAETHAHRLQRQLADLQERMREREERYMELEIQLAAASAEREALQRKVGSAGQRLQQLQEESSALLTANHQLTADNMKLQHQLREAEEEVNAARESSSAAAAWWRTRETKADATLRQQAKLIDFLQSKVEESSRKKKTLGNMLFGSRSHSTKDAAPPAADVTRALVRERQVNRELREELTRLKSSSMPASKSPIRNGRGYTPKLDRKKSFTNGYDLSPGKASERDCNVRIIRDGSKGAERVSACIENGYMLWRSGATETRARLLTDAPTHARSLSHTDAMNAFTVRTVTCDGDESETITVICDSSLDRTSWLKTLKAPGAGPVVGPGLGYAPRALLSTDTFRPTCLIEPTPSLYAIGTEDGLYSYQSGNSSATRVTSPGVSRVDAMCVVPQAARVLLLAEGALRSLELRQFLSTLERAACVAPAVHSEPVSVGNGAPITLIEVMPRRHSAERTLVCVSAAKRIFFLTHDPSSGWRTLRSVELSTQATALLFTPHTLLVAADRVYEIDIQRYDTEEFLDLSDSSLRIASRPQAILAIRDRSADDETEYLICYKQVGIFVDEFGRRTRSDDVKWSGTPIAWSFRKPYLFVLQEDRVEVSKIDECAYRLPACQCDAVSMASTVSDCAIPDKCTVNLQKPHILGKSSSAGALLLREGAGRSCSIVEVDGTRALKKIGVSVETLDSQDSEDVLPSNGHAAQSLDEPDHANESDNESTHTADSSAECRTDFLADIRKRAKQIRTKIQEDKRKDEAIRQILASEITGKFVPRSRRHSDESMDSEFSVESSADGRASENGQATDSAAECHVVGKTTADICNEIFLRKQVRFDSK